MHLKRCLFIVRFQLCRTPSNSHAQSAETLTTASGHHHPLEKYPATAYLAVMHVAKHITRENWLMEGITHSHSGLKCSMNSWLALDVIEHGRTYHRDQTSATSTHGQKITSSRYLKVVQMTYPISNRCAINVSSVRTQEPNPTPNWSAEIIFAPSHVGYAVCTINAERRKIRTAYY